MIQQDIYCDLKKNIKEILPVLFFISYYHKSLVYQLMRLNLTFFKLNYF